MRPCHLVLEGLRSYRDQAEIDFSRLDLTALIGDTGAGKSSIIEALTVALFNRPTFMGKNVSALRADGAPAMRVVLTFTVGDAAHLETWTVTRIHKANATPSVHKLVCDETGEKVDGERRINDRLEELIGLNYDQFTRAVVIPQGQFAKLLEQTPAQRTETLKGIFRLDHLTEIKVHADGMLKRFAKPVSERRGQRDLLPKDPKAEAAEAEEHLDRTRLSAAALETAVQEAEEHRVAGIEAQTRAAGLTGALTRMQEHVRPECQSELSQAAGALTDIETVLEAAALRRKEHAAGADEYRRQATAALAPFAVRDDAVAAKAALSNAITAAERLARAGGELAERKRELEDPQRTAERETLERQAAEARRIADETATADKSCQGEAQTNETEVKKQRDAVTNARNVARSLDAALLATRGVLDRAVEANALATVAGSCRPGDDCPVCAQTLPPAFVPPSDPGIDQARHAYSEAVGQLDVAAKAVEEAEQRLTDAQQEWEQCRAKAQLSNEARERTESQARAAEEKAATARAITPPSLPASTRTPLDWGASASGSSRRWRRFPPPTAPRMTIRQGSTLPCNGSAQRCRLQKATTVPPRPPTKQRERQKVTRRRPWLASTKRCAGRSTMPAVRGHSSAGLWPT